MTSGVYFSSVGYGWHLCATFSLFSRHWNGFFRLFSHCYLHPSSSSVSCKFLSGGSAACAFIQPSSCFCLFSFVSPLRVGEQSGVPSVGCTPIQRTKDDLGIFGFSALWLFPMQLATTPFTTHLSSSLLAFGFLCISS